MNMNCVEAGPITVSNQDNKSVMCATCPKTILEVYL